MISEEGIVTYLNILKNGKASTPHAVPTNLVKDTAKFSTKPLTTIFDASVEQENFPNT